MHVMLLRETNGHRRLEDTNSVGGVADRRQHDDTIQTVLYDKQQPHAIRYYMQVFNVLRLHIMKTIFHLLQNSPT